MDTPRSVFKIDQNTPGSEVAAETAAALAAASLVFRRSDRTYSKLLARRAISVSKYVKLNQTWNFNPKRNKKQGGSFSTVLPKFPKNWDHVCFWVQVFEFADKHRGAYSTRLKKYVCPFYCDYSGYQVYFSVNFPIPKLYCSFYFLEGG